jgi:hypothetical protein
MNWVELGIWGLVGGLILQFASLAEYQYTASAQRPSWLSEKFFWIIAAGMVLIGGVFAAGTIPQGVIPHQYFWVPVQVGMAIPALLNIGGRAGGSRMGPGSHD